MGVNFTRNQVAKEKQRIETTRPTGFTFPLGLTFGKLVVASQNAFPTSTGGTKTTDITNSIHTFTTSNTFKPILNFLKRFPFWTFSFQKGWTPLYATKILFSGKPFSINKFLQ